MNAERLNQFRSTIAGDNNHPYLNGAWTPNTDEYEAFYRNGDSDVIGEIPDDIDGVYLRNTENQLHEPLGRYHPFDGDGMLHCMAFRDGKAEYRNRFVQTAGFTAEQEAGKSLWAGIAEDPGRSMQPGWGAQGSLKDSSSTDVIVHAGQALSTFYQCGEGYRLDPYTLETIGTESWVPPEGVSAHTKLDEQTGELLFFNYSKQAPYQHYGVVNKHNKLVHYTPVPLPGPRLPHDMAFTRNWSILADLPFFWEPKFLAHGQHVPVFHREMPTRFSILPRYGNADEIRIFEAESTYVLHWMNACEVGDEIILDGYFQEDPSPPPLADVPGALGRLMAGIDMSSFKPRLHRWRFNMKTGTMTETHLDDRDLEFGMFNQRYAGSPSRYLYSVTNEPGWFLFNGLVKHDFETGASEQWSFGAGRYGSESPFVPRRNPRSEDDGYLVSFVTDMNENSSECVLVDAQQISAGPVCRIRLPHRICSGTHATWAPGEQIRASARS